MPKQALLMGLSGVRLFRAKISPETCRVRKEMAANPDLRFINRASFFYAVFGLQGKGRKGGG